MEFNIAHINPSATNIYHLPKFTVVVERFDKDSLLDYIDGQLEETVSPLQLIAGVTKCHKNDNYNKKVGVSLAKSRAKEMFFDFLSIRRQSDRHLYEFMTPVFFHNIEYYLYITLSTVPHSDNVKLESVYICDKRDIQF